MPVQLVNLSKKNKRSFYGKIAQGKIKKNDKIKILPANTETEVSEVLTLDKNYIAEMGDSIKISFKNEVDCSRGDILTSINSNIKVSDQFNTTLIWMDNSQLITGREYWLQIGTRITVGRIQKINSIADIDNLKQLSSKTLGLNDIGNCILITNETIAYTPFKTNKELGGFILIDKETNNTVAAGLINFALKRTENIFFQKRIIISFL